MPIVGKVESLWRYPVKSMRGEEMDELFAGYAGVYADRLFAFSKPWPALQFFFVTLSTIALASISYWTYEKFFLRLKAKFSSRRKPEEQPTLEVALSTK